MTTMNKNIFTLLLFTLSLFAAAFFAYQWRQAEARQRQTVAWTHTVLDSVTTTMEFPVPPYLDGVRDSVYWQWVATGAQLRLRKAQEVVRHWVGLRSTLLDEIDLQQLKKEGLNDPPRQLRESLIARADLIPFPGELGGTMRFHEDGIILLEAPYAFATFEDGHNQGSMLLRYEVLPGGQVEWERVWETLE